MTLIKNHGNHGKDREILYSEKQCSFCDKTFKPNSSRANTCSPECSYKRKRLTQNNYYRRNAKRLYQSMLKYLPKRLARQQAMRLFRKLGIKNCQKCQGDYRPQVHHIDFNQFNNSRNNLIMLCQWCHVKAHGKGL